MKRLITSMVSIVLLAVPLSHSGQLFQSWENRLGLADAVVQATVHSTRSSSSNGMVTTEVGLHVEKGIKGIFTETVKVHHAGGIHKGTVETYCGCPKLARGQSYVLFLAKTPDGRLGITDYIRSDEAPSLNPVAGGIDASAQTWPERQLQTDAVGVIPGSTGYGSRFLQCDRGEPIEYLVDIDYLPSGITSNQALAAIRNAFDEWSAQTSLQFEFAGIESFSTSANAVTISDGRIRIQMHDAYEFIDNESSTLGRGGHSYSFDVGSWPEGGLGGRVGNNEFDRVTRGYLVIEHTKAANSNPVTLEEVVSHELGHVLGLAHSSETFGETDPVLADAQMYYQIHADGRGASLRAWDLTNILDFYPTNAPPYGFDRVIRAITAPSTQAPLNAGVNQVGFGSFDLQDAITPILISETGNYGTFTIENSDTVFYTPSGWYGDSSEAGAFSYYDSCYIRLSDGVNLSPPIWIRVIQLLADYQNPSNYADNSNYLPNSWESFYGVSGTEDDPDNDGFSNLEEWLLGTNPTDGTDGLFIGLLEHQLSWNTRPYELYQLQSSTNLANGFVDFGTPVLASSTNLVESIGSQAQQFYRVQRLR